MKPSQANVEIHAAHDASGLGADEADDENVSWLFICKSPISESRGEDLSLIGSGLGLRSMTAISEVTQ
jgi:hypothetical protein